MLTYLCNKANLVCNITPEYPFSSLKYVYDVVLYDALDDSTNHASYDCLQKDIAYVIHQYIASASDLMS